MWFRPSAAGSGQVDSDRFRVSSFKRRIRGRKSPIKSSSVEAETVPTTPEDAVNIKSLKSQKAATDPPKRKLSKSFNQEKEKTLLTDRKFKNNRIEKSSSKTKVNDLEKRDSVRSGTRKISAPPILVDVATTATASPIKRNMRVPSNLNLLALYKLVGSGNKKLSTEDFDRIRRKSLSEAASSVMAVASATCKPIALVQKCETEVADDITNDNVVLVKHDTTNSFDDSINNNNSDSTQLNGECRCSVGNDNNNKDDVSSSDEDDYDVADNNNKKSSPSLTSRVAAKISETTNYKNRKLKAPKKPPRNRRSELYKQNSFDRPHSTSVVRQPSDRRPDLTNTSINSGGTASHNTSELTTSQYLDADTSALDAEHDSKRGDRSKSKSAPVSVNRSESYKERLSHKRNRNNRRKTSDPSLSKTNDEQTEVGLSNDNYTASSSSSISSGSLESPSSSLEQVSGPGGHAAVGGPMTTATGTVPTPRQWVDSEDEAELIELDWSSHVSPEILAALSDAEKKRQEIINEIFQTERNHVRTLRLLEGLFMRPLQESNVLPHDHLQILFPPALLSLKDLHSSFEQKLKLRRVENGHIVRYVGDLLVGMFEGHSGDDLREYAAQFCARQQIALEALKEKRRKDENLQRLLTKAESHKACRRLQLKDLLPTVLQRLTKYPLLFENLYKITKRVNPDDEREADAIQRALDSSKRILVDVNQAVKSAEDAHKLQTIQRKLDKSSFDKDASNEFKNLDLTQFKLVYDGQLTMKKNPGVQLHGLLFENMMVLLQKQDDKYFLKYFPNLAAGTNENNKLISPITHFDQQTLVRQSAVDKNTFFLIITKTSQMLELRAPSSSECKTWFKHISDAAEQYKPRSKSSHEVVEDPATSTLPHSNTKESLEAAATSTTERSASTAGSNNNFNVDNTTTSGYQQQDQSQINATSTPSDKAKITYSNNNNTTLDTQRGGGGDSKYESNNNASNQKLDGSDDKGGGLTATNQNELRRDSVYSNNSNNTRTLMQHCPLLEPSEIQISISPALTAEPVLTPTEKLRRLDESIRERLAEKQKIICDMFRVPNEHFTAIADIAAQPEAPKDPSDIVLAAFAQVQSLTEVLSEYMKITPEQEISAVSTAVCDQCHQRSLRSVSPLPSSIASTNTGTTVLSYPDAGGISGGCISSSSNKDDLEFAIVLEDDGYCEIDPLRLPSVMPNPNQTTPGLKPLPPPPPSSSASSTSTTGGHISTSTPELIKRQSTISADSIPEESEQDITHEEQQLNNSNSMAKDKNNSTLLQSDTSIDENQKITDDSLGSEHIEVNETYDSAASLNKGISTSNLIKASNNQLCTVFATELELCGPNRLAHVQNLEPSIPCHVISGFVTALSAQISLLLPKINERDIERERLRRENQHLRELLNAMHERQRVEEEKETPDNTKSAENSDEIPDNKIPEQQPPSTLSPEQQE